MEIRKIRTHYEAILSNGKIFEIIEEHGMLRIKVDEGKVKTESTGFCNTIRVDYESDI